MAIHINPERINTRPAFAGKSNERRGAAAATPSPKRAQLDFIPSPESLATLIRNAVDALRHGARWDRGSIINILA